jgi:hypothetical protein
MVESFDPDVFCWKFFSVESSKSKDTLSLSPYVLFGAESLDL